MLPETIKDFIYLDVGGIELLYSQLVDRVETKRSESNKKLLTGSVSTSGSLQSTFLSILGQADIGGKAEGSGTKETGLTAELMLSIHSKLKTIVESLKEIEYGICFSSLSAAADYSTKNSQKVFFCGQHKFDAPQFMAGNEALDVSESGNLLLQCTPRYEESDGYFKKPQFTAKLSCSIQKMPRSQNGMNRSGHDAVYFRAYHGTQIPLWMFCSVIPLPNMVQLKPYAIWV